MAGPWERYQQGPAAPANPVIAPPDPYRQAAEQRAQAGEVRAQQDQGIQAHTAALQGQLTQLQIAEAQRKAEEAAVERQAVQDAGAGATLKLTNVIDKIDEVAFDSADNGGWGETGFFGAALRNVPGTPALDLASNVATIDANSAFEALAEMRRNSPTGGALGQVTERELDLLRSTISNLNTSQSQEQFFSNLADAKRAYLTMLRRVDPAAADAYEKRKGIRWDKDGNAVLVSVEGEDTRDPTDPMGVMASPPPPGGGGGGGLSLETFGRGIDQGVGDIVEGVGNMLGIVTNPVGQAMYDALGYEGRYDTGTILREGAGLPDNPNGTASLVNQGVTAALTGSAAARGISSLLQPGVAQNALNVIGRTPVRDAVAGGGAGAGAAAGKASGVPGGEFIGTLVGGLAAYGGASGVNALANVARQGAPNALAEAAARQSVDLLPADAGGATARAVTTGTKASPLSVAPVVQAAQRQQRQMGAAARRTAESQGEVVSTEQAGQSVRSAAERFTRQSSQRGSRLYERANEAAKGVLIKPLQTIARLDEQIARLGNDPSAPPGLADELTRFKAKIESGVNVIGLRDARTRLSQGVYDGKMRAGPDQAMWRDILGNLSSDIEMGLQNAGRGQAASMFRRADAFWRERVQHIDEVLEPLMGRGRGGEEIVGAVERMARGQSGGNARLSRLLAEMTPEEAGQVRATIIDRIGQASPGAQGAEGGAFSASTFLTNWNKMTTQAKGSLFADRGLRQNLDDLARLAEGMKVSGQMANHSNTGMAIGGNAALGTAAFILHPVAAVLGAGAQVMTGKLMASPGFARILARSAKMSPEAAARSLPEQLGILAGREPLVANDARAVQQYLSEALSRSPDRLAAREQERD